MADRAWSPNTDGQGAAAGARPALPAEARLRREQIHRARLALPVLAVAAFAWVAFLVFTWRASVPSWAFVVTFGAGIAISSLMARAGHVRPAAILLMVVATHPAAALIGRFGVAGPASATLLLLIVAYGLLVGRSSLAVWTAICCALVLFLAWREGRASGASRIAPAAAWCGLYVAAAALTALIARAFEGLIQLARGQTQALVQLLAAADPAGGTRGVGARSLAVIATELGAEAVALWRLAPGRATLVREHAHPADGGAPGERPLPARWSRLAREGVLDPDPGDGLDPPGAPANGLLVRLGPAERPDGVLVVRAPAGRRFDRDDRDLALALAHQTALALRLARAAEREREIAVLQDRQRIAREIHDGLAQGFTGIVLQLGAAEQALAGDPERARTHLDRARTLARASLAEARRSLWALRPAALGDGDLAAALGHVARELAAGAGVEVAVETDGRVTGLPDEIAHELLRIGQEAIANALRHGAPRHLAVSLRRRGRLVRLAVRDDGRGLAAGPSDGLGTTAMRERVARLGGRLRLTSAPGAGTEVSLLVPVARQSVGARP